MIHTRFARLLHLAVVAICCLAWSSNPVVADKVTFDWATVGDPGNGGDTIGNGSVGYIYRISKHEVTNAQYTCFLNAVDSSGANGLGLYNTKMSSEGNGGINFNGTAANGSKYETKPGQNNNPVIHVSYIDAMRFTNWLHNGQGTGSIESGVYSIGTGLDETRAAGARFFIPSDDEWYKAAYYDPNTGSYFDFAAKNNAIPTSEPPPGSGTNSANYQDDVTGNFAVTGSSTFSLAQNYLSDVGAYTTSLSPYGTFDQSGNVQEWSEDLIGASGRGLRGGSWADNSVFLRKGVLFLPPPTFENRQIGFRVAASVPDNPTIIAPDAFTVARGDYASGGLTELAESDNSDLTIRRRNADLQSRTEFEVKSTSPTTTPTTFEFMLEGSVFARGNVVQTIELFDYNADAWELVDSSNARRAPAPDSVVTATPTGDLSRFVKAGTMCVEARVLYKSDRNRQKFASNTDQAIWMIGQ